MREVVGVLRGGPSSQYELSLKSGANVLSALDTSKYEPRDIFIDRSGVWHVHGAPQTPERALSGIDVAVNIVHGQYGEDGTLQRILEALNVPYTGSDAVISALAFNKHRTTQEARKLGLTVAHGSVIDSAKITDLHKTALNIFRAMPLPLTVKPITGGLDTIKVEHFDALEFALNRAFAISPQALVEEYIAGKEASVGVIDNFRNEKAYALMPAEKVLQRVPGHFSTEEKRALMSAAKAVHQGLGLRHYSRSDFIVAPRGIYFLEVHPAAGIDMSTESLFPKALQAVGSRTTDFFDHVIQLAKNPKKD